MFELHILLSFFLSFKVSVYCQYSSCSELDVGRQDFLFFKNCADQEWEISNECSVQDDVLRMKEI
jgi:hypothetical protein